MGHLGSSLRPTSLAEGLGRVGGLREGQAQSRIRAGPSSPAEAQAPELGRRDRVDRPRPPRRHRLRAHLCLGRRSWSSPSSTLSRSFVYLPAWIVAIGAGIGRRYVLAGAALLVVVAQLFFVLPEFTAAQPAPSWAASSTAASDSSTPTSTFSTTRRCRATSARSRRTGPSWSPWKRPRPWRSAISRAQARWRTCPSDFEVSRYDSRAFFIASKYRLSGSHVVYFNGVPLIVETTIHLPSGHADRSG